MVMFSPLSPRIQGTHESNKRKLINDRSSSTVRCIACHSPIVVPTTSEISQVGWLVYSKLQHTHTHTQESYGAEHQFKMFA